MGHAAERLRQSSENGARIVVGDDLRRIVSELGHRLSTPLVEPNPVPVTSAGEARHVVDDGHREERALERIVAEQASQIVAAEHDASGETADGDLRDSERYAP